MVANTPVAALDLEQLIEEKTEDPKTPAISTCVCLGPITIEHLERGFHPLCNRKIAIVVWEDSN